MEIKVSYMCENRVKEGDTVLDVCCGSGDLAFLLSEKVGIKGKVCYSSSSSLSSLLFDYLFQSEDLNC